ncbi:YnfU family zinc-binding protein [Klebsiella pneumoniae]
MASTSKQQKTSTYLINCACPKCSKTAEHSAPRVHKNKKLLCPYCNTIFSFSECKNVTG